VAILDIVDEVCRQYALEGLRLERTAWDETAARLELGLGISDPAVADNVPPGPYLEDEIAAGVLRRADRGISVIVHDETNRTLPAGQALAGRPASSMVTVLDPRVSPVRSAVDSGPDAGPLRGKVVLIRVDVLWHSWDWVAAEWAAALREAGAEVVFWRRSQGVSADQGDQQQKEYEEHVRSADVLISGLGNCGSCTAWTIRDALQGLSGRVSTLAVVTTQFHAIARALADGGGFAGLRIFDLPYPLNDRPEAEVREIARARFADAMAQLGAEV
jgi:hypothetical protein